MQKQEIALNTVQGVVSWSESASRWAVRCQRAISKSVVTLHTFVAHWVAKLRYWMSCSDQSVTRAESSPQFAPLARCRCLRGPLELPQWSKEVAVTD